MANPGGGVGAKFLSVNLNKSYGQPSHHNHPAYSSSYGQAAAGGRVRPVSGGSGGGMVVLSRSRSSQKATGPKLSVPPPLNLPSLRKEHERFDLSGSGGGTASGAGPGSGQRPTSSGMGWTKPVAVALQEKDISDGDTQVEPGGHVDGEGKGTGAYMPPSARPGGAGLTVSSAASARPFPKPVEKSVVLRGEDFPSLQAALPVPSGPGQKQKDTVNQKQKLVMSEEFSDQQRDGVLSNSLVDMRPHGQTSRNTSGSGTMENGGVGRRLGSSSMPDQHRKQDYFPGPLPLVRLNPRFDWADDERDTGHGISERGRDLGLSKTENYWKRDFDMPRASVLPHKPVHNQYERWGLRDDETGRKFSSDVSKGDLYRREIRIPSREGREGNAWRSSPLPKDGFNSQEAANDRNSVGARTTAFNKDFGKDNKYIPRHVGDPSQAGGVSASQETSFGRRNTGHFLEGRPQWNSIKESFNSLGAERNPRERYGTEQSNKYRDDGFQDSTISKSLFASGGKMPPGTDPILTSGREKRVSSKTERPYCEDPFISSAGFDERDPFSGSLVGVIKRKKEVVKQIDFHDPVRESFEAELERVQKMQELERQRIMEEQERVLEQARREEEERQRLIREEEAQKRRLEEEAQEAAWRAEQERLEAIRRAEEQKIAREEERKRILIEDERRKQAAKQKLLELEERMAKRKAEVLKSDSSVAVTHIDDKLRAILKERDFSSSTDIETWEDSEKMVERITASASFDTTVLNRPFEITSRPPYPNRDGSSAFVDKGKPFSSWGRDGLENGSSASSQLQENDSGHFSPRRDSFTNVRALPRKDVHGGFGYMSSRTYLRGGQEPYVDEFGHQKEQGWNFSGDADPFSRSREMDSEFQDHLAEKYGDVGWSQNRFRGNTHSPYPERPYPTEADDLYSYGRSRYSLRQPRVLPPPIASKQRNSFRGANEHPGPSGFLGDDHYGHAERSESTRHTGYYAGHQDGRQPSEIVDMPKEVSTLESQKLNKDLTSRCDSQSSVSVSSPPNSPPHLSHDELDDSGDSPMISTTAEGKHISLTGDKSLTLNDNSGQHPSLTVSSSISAIEDEEWALENNDDLQQQEEYDEDEDGYQEEDEVREGDDGNLDLNQEFEDLHLEEKGSSHMMDNLVLGFDEGVEVEIPNDDFDRNFSNEERGFGMPDLSIHIEGEEGQVDCIKGDEQSCEHVSGFPAGVTMVQETEKPRQDSVVKPADDPYTSITSDNNVLSGQQTMSPSVDMPSSAGLTMISTASSAPSQVDTPVKLQFGLFSGPSLIPSPVTAIQIGSIQMPLHLHPPIGPSLTHIHPSQPPIFQFGQLRYTSPISQGVLPIAPQSMSFVQPSVQSQDTSLQNVMKDEVPSLTVTKQSGFASEAPNQSHGSPSPGLSSVLAKQSADNSSVKQITNVNISSGCDDQLKSELSGQAESRGQNNAVTKKHLPSSRGRISEGQLQSMQPSSESSEKNFGGMKAQDFLSGSKGKRVTYAIRNSSTRSSFPASDISTSDTNGFQRRSRRTVQRTEFRVRSNVERRQPTGSFSSNNLNLDDKSNYRGRSSTNFARSGSKRGTMSSKPLKQIADSESSKSGNVISQDVESGSLVGKEIQKDMPMRAQNLSQSGEANLKRNIAEEDVDAPLQSGVVRVFKQPGIEAPSDEDDFIEVRSKRQMLNDRREQREKEIKAKSRPPRKPRPTRQSSVGLTNSKNVSRSLGGESSQSIHLDFTSPEGRILAYKDASAPLVSQPLAPIGTPAVKSEIQADKRSQSIKPHQTSSVSIVSSGGNDLGPTLMFESKNKVIDNVPSSLSSWDTARINQQVMALTQTQLEEAMKPPRFDTPISSVGGHSSSVGDSLLPSSSILTKERSFSTAASPINSLLAGEKIQFGAVTSPPILPPSSRAPGSSRPDIQISHKLSVAEDDCTLFFKKDKQTADSCVQLQDSEAEAEAAASAVAVAAISTDEVVVGSVGISDSKSFRGADIDGMACDQQLASQSRTEESLSVSLPADLSVETPPICLWPPLPSPQNSSSQMLSHFPGGPPSHFPFYDMNPMLGGPIFAFGPHEEPAGTQSQPQKSSTTSSSGPLGTWQQCHSTVDSFYGPSAAYAGPFIGPPGGIPGVQGPPHMVVYNHFAPVGQFGQVGLSFMGPTYIPSGKPPDWKHNSSSAVGMNEGDMNNVNIAAGQRNPPNMATPMQHLASGSPLMPMASPLAMFDASPFQSASDISVQARWSHVPASALHSVPLSRPLQQGEGVPPSQFGHTHPIDQSLNVRFSESRTSTPSTSGPSFTVAAEVNASQLPDELGLVGSSRSTIAGASTQSAVSQSASASVTADAGTSNLRTGGSNSSEGHSTSGFKTRSSQQKNLSAQQSYSAGYNYPRGGSGTSHRNNAGNEWPHRRMGFHGRNQSFGSEKGLPSSKMKQIYVAKQTTSGTSTTG
ncbi:hypothetical protein ACH5RR_011430 [Cinchona calisaya]|uniref:Uncharacterized protein n=1 Tax=Cinchona calisaya TaxID=153742 RepID=A0ABD3A6A2_9GENT